MVTIQSRFLARGLKLYRLKIPTLPLQFKTLYLDRKKLLRAIHDLSKARTGTPRNHPNHKESDALLVTLTMMD